MVAQSLQWLFYEVDSRRTASIFGRESDFSLRHSTQTIYGAHPASYPTRTSTSFPGFEADPLTHHVIEVKKEQFQSPSVLIPQYLIK